MATPFRLKRSAIEGKRPAESALQRGELALNTYDGYLYTEREGVGLSPLRILHLGMRTMVVGQYIIVIQLVLEQQFLSIT